jgi:hypothetical protein
MIPYMNIVSIQDRDFTRDRVRNQGYSCHFTRACCASAKSFLASGLAASSPMAAQNSADIVDRILAIKSLDLTLWQNFYKLRGGIKSSRRFLELPFPTHWVMKVSKFVTGSAREGDSPHAPLWSPRSGGWLCKLVFGVLFGVLVVNSTANAQRTQPAAQIRVNDFPSVRGYDPGYSIPYDPHNPYLALEYINQQFDGVWTDIDAGTLDIRKYFSRAPQAEDYTDPNRPNPTSNTPHLTPAAAKVFSKMRPMILAGNNPGQAVGWCFISHAPTTSYWNQFMFTPDSMNASIPGGGGSIYAHVYMDGRPHPPKVVQSETGHQIGHWEGATLVIDGVGYVGDRDLEIGLLNSDQEHVITRYRRLEPDLLEAEYTVTDPKVLAQPWTFKRRFRRGTMDITLLRDSMHCVTNVNRPDPESGGNQLLSPEGKQLPKVPTE